MKKFISSGVFVKALVRLANRLFSSGKSHKNDTIFLYLMYIYFYFLVEISNNQDIKTMCRTIIELSTDSKNRLDLWLQRIIVGWNKDKDLIEATSTLSRELSLFLTNQHTNSIKHFVNNISPIIDPDENFELIKNMVDFIVGLNV